MIYYKDITFCREDKCKFFGDGDMDCPRSLTDKVGKDAEDWWGGPDVPFCVFMEKPACFQEVEQSR